MSQSTVITFVIAVFLFHTASAVQPSGKNCGPGMQKVEEKTSVEEPLFKLDKDKQLVGLTKHGLEKVVAAKEGLKAADHIMNYNYFETESFLEGLRIAQVGQFNLGVGGLAGGAKTEFFRKALPGLWVTQVHEMMDQVPLIGGQTFAGAEAGRQEINSEGTMLTARYAMLDEGHNANPAVLLTTLSVTNEKVIYVNGQPRHAKDLRTVIFTANANYYEILEAFRESGRAASGPAFLNRLQFKMEFPNWLSDESQAKLDKLERRRKHLKAISQSDPSVLKDLALQEPEDIDADTLERFAYAMFETTDEFEVVLRTFVQKLKEAQAKAVKESVIAAQDDSTPYVLVPSTQFTTRLRKDIANVAIVSAALDYLRSPLATPENLAKLGKKKIKLGPLSLWRTWPVLTMVGGNQVIFDPYNQKIHFESKVIGKNKIQPPNFEKLIEDAESKRDEKQIEHRRGGQDRFLAALNNQWTHLKSVSEEVARLTSSNDPDDIDFDNTDFEFTLASHGSANVMKVK